MELAVNIHPEILTKTEIVRRNLVFVQPYSLIRTSYSNGISSNEFRSRYTNRAISSN